MPGETQSVRNRIGGGGRAGFSIAIHPGGGNTRARSGGGGILGGRAGQTDEKQAQERDQTGYPDPGKTGMEPVFSCGGGKLEGGIHGCGPFMRLRMTSRGD